MFWKINFTIDTGYDWLKRICIISAPTEEEAKERFKKWVNPLLTGEKCVLDKDTKITPIEISEEQPILYQDAFKEKEEK